MICFVLAKRGHSYGIGCDGDYWKCPRCGYWPGPSYGPPDAACLNCGAPLYTTMKDKEGTLIITRREKHLLLFDMPRREDVYLDRTDAYTIYYPISFGISVPKQEQQNA